MADQSQDPAVSFAAFIVSLASSAMVHLGLAKDPGQAEQGVDLVLARQTIEVLALLEEKTSGNLDEEESQLLETLLSDLRVHYVKVSDQAGAAAKAEATTPPAAADGAEAD